MNLRCPKRILFRAENDKIGMEHDPLFSLRRKFVNDMKADTPMADLCDLGGWKSPLTVMTVYQQADQVTMRSALSNRDRKRLAVSG